MMYRILTNGEKYRIQYRSGVLSRWQYVSKRDGAYDCAGEVPINWDSEQEADDYARKTWGESAERIKQWRIL
jgi:hypothetical protein